MPATRSRHEPLGLGDCRALADALGDSPETVITTHLLRRGLARAYVAGEPARFDGAVVQWQGAPEEPAGHGVDAAVLWDLLQSVDGWTSINVTPSCAAAIGRIIETEAGMGVRYDGDVYHTLIQPASNIRNGAVRLLTPDDLPLVEAAPVEVRGAGFESPAAMLTEGVVAGAIVSGGLVAMANTGALTERHADIGVSTLEPWRCRGFATAAASIVAQRVQAGGRIPVWSVGETNAASLRVAEKLGFTEVSRRMYVIVDAGTRHKAEETLGAAETDS